MQVSLFVIFLTLTLNLNVMHKIFHKSIIFIILSIQGNISFTDANGSIYARYW